MAPLTAEVALPAAENLGLAAAATKCAACGCLAGSLETIAAAAGPDAGGGLTEALAAARAHVVPTRYDCLGCDVCWPAVALNAIADANGADGAAAACPTEPAAPRDGWPPLPGAYRVLRHRAPVAVCTLDDDAILEAVAADAGPEIAIVGSLRTENLGIERLITNVVSNPHIRFLVLAGADARQRVGHLPGESLLALGANGLDARGRIVGAPGKRPVLRNVSAEVVEHFRATVELVDRIGEHDPLVVLGVAAECARRDPGPADPLPIVPSVPVDRGRMPARTVPDPAGYFVVYADASRSALALEHYRNDGLLDRVVEGATGAELYMAAIEDGLVSRLDHAAYLGRELARAEIALARGEPYVQDGAPEAAPTAPCSCGGSCEG
jgi:tetrahydromethanopterin S-methyltransferase subunit A